MAKVKNNMFKWAGKVITPFTSEVLGDLGAAKEASQNVRMIEFQTQNAIGLGLPVPTELVHRLGKAAAKQARAAQIGVDPKEASRLREQARKILHERG